MKNIIGAGFIYRREWINLGNYYIFHTIVYLSC